MSIYAFHLLNDQSGSPKVLAQVLKGLVEKGEKVHLVSSMKQEGFLSNIAGVEYIENRYVFRKNVVLRLLQLMFVQLYILITLYRKIKPTDVIYINTVLPFGGAILGKIKGCKVIYHLHETSMKPEVLKRFLFFFVKTMGTEAIYVSQYLKEEEPVRIKSHVVYNSIEKEYLIAAKKSKRLKNVKPIVLMICSLKEYKGVQEFVDLARGMQSYRFQLVVNADALEIAHFFKHEKLPKNLSLFPRQKEVGRFYAQADVLMNLSRPDQWVETFGLTVIEAMVYGVPSIVPPVGGIAELVEDGVNGFKVSCYDTINLKKSLISLLQDNDLHSRMRKECLLRVNNFSEENQLAQIHQIIIA